MKLLIHTERLVIRDYQETDWKDIIAHTTQEDVACYMQWDTDTWAEREIVVAWIKKQQDLSFDTYGKYIEFAIVKDGKTIGGVGIKRLSKVNEVAEVGWTLNSACWGKGYATEATAAFMDYCFANLGLHRITSMCDARNTASYRLMERLGFRQEGHHVKSSFIKGEWVDDLVYAILLEEWLARPRPDYRAKLAGDNPVISNEERR